MRILITAGPTREHIDPVRFITNASSGRMGYAVASAAAESAHDVTLLTGPVAMNPPPGCKVERFVTVADLAASLGRLFGACDALVMAAAVSDFSVEGSSPSRLHRASGPVDLRLLPTQDVLASVAEAKRQAQVIVAFAVEDGRDADIEERARAKLSAKNADYIVVNTLEAIAAPQSRAAILSATDVVLPWGRRPKERLARHIIGILDGTFERRANR